ncbi:MAG: type II toxin-antitoxin system RelE family toxin [Dehalococcoidia bacterium]
MTYRILLRPAARRQLRALSRDIQQRLRPAIDALREDYGRRV